jgi:hypothetical protein
MSSCAGRCAGLMVENATGLPIKVREVGGVAVSVVDFGWSRGSDRAAAMPLTSLQ